MTRLKRPGSGYLARLQRRTIVLYGADALKLSLAFWVAGLLVGVGLSRFI